MNRYTKLALQTVFTLIILAVAGIYLWINKSELTILRNIRIIDICLISTVMLFWLFISGFTFKLLVGAVDVKLSIFEFFGLTILTSFGNYLGPLRPGAAIKAMYLKSVKGLQYAKFTSVLIANAFLILFINGLIALLLIIIFHNQNIHVPQILIYICLGLTVGTMIPFFYRFSTIPIKGKIGEVLQSALVGFNTIYKYKLRLIGICSTLLLQMLVGALLFVIIYRSLGISLNYYTSLFVSVFISISSFFSITPNNIGIQEAVTALIFSLTGFDFTVGVIGAGLLRIVHILLTFLLAPLTIHFLLKKKRIKSFRSI